LRVSGFPSGGGRDDGDSDPESNCLVNWSRQCPTGLPGSVRMFRHLFFLQTRSDRALDCIAALISLRRPFKCRSASPFDFPPLMSETRTLHEFSLYEIFGEVLLAKSATLFTSMDTFSKFENFEDLLVNMFMFVQGPSGHC
jgi:hypothetical protein